MTPFTSSTTQFFSSSSSSFTTQNLLLLLFTTIIIFSHGTTAQDSSRAPPPPTPYFNPRFNPTMAIIIVILIAAFFFLGFFSIYLRQCRNDPGRSSWGGPATTARSRGVGARGLDPELIEKFPTLVYSEVKVHKIGNGALECAVCLSEFEDDQMLRLLPICDHVFHPECIDQWLGSHTTCPVCRTNLAVAVDLSNSNVEQQSVATPAEEGGGDLRSSGRRDEVSIPVRNEVEQVDCTASPPPVLDLRRGGSLRAAARSILSWGSKSARPAVGAQAGQLWSEEERERFTLRLPDYVRQDVLAGKLSRSISVTVFPTEESLRRGFRGGGGMDGEGSSRGGGRSLKLRGGGQARFDRWAFLTSFNWRSVAGGGGDGEGSIRREGSIKREGSTRRGGGGDGGGLEGSTKGLFGPLDCLGSSGGGSGGNSSVKRNGSTTRKDADGE